MSEQPDGPLAGSPETANHLVLQRMAGSLVLLTGERVHVRPIRPDDAARLQAFHLRLSATSILYRFFRVVPALPDVDAEHFARVDYESRMALVATEDPAENGQLLGVARYDRVTSDTAEVAFAVEDHWQGHGIATALLRWLAPYARMRGVTRFQAITLASNAKMLEVLQHAGYPLTSHFSGSEFTITLDISAPAPGEPDLAS